MLILITFTCLTQIQAKGTSKIVGNFEKRRGSARSTWLTLVSFRVQLTTAVVVAFPEDIVLVAGRIVAEVVAGTASETEVDTGAHLLDTFLVVYTPPGKADMVVE